MLQTIRNAWRIEELRGKMIFTLLIIVIFRLGNAVPVPFIDTEILAAEFARLETTILGLYNVMSGGAFETASIFALSIQPYITASIVMQLLCVAIPALERLQKEGGEDGKKLINKITRYGTVALGLVMGFAYYLMLSNWNILAPEAQGFWPGLIIILSFTAGASLVMWLGEQITEFGIGNGISIILFAGIVSRFPVALFSMSRGVQAYFTGVVPAGVVAMPWWLIISVLAGALLLVVLIVVIQNSERKIPVQYAKRVVGRKMYGGQSTHLPIKLSMTGVLPIIFAQALASLPATIAVFANPAEGGVLASIANFFDPARGPYLIMYILLIVFFSYFYAQIQFNPIEISNNLKKNGGYIPGFRPGKPTQDHITKILGKITLFGAVYLAVVAGLPILVGLIPFFGIGAAAQQTGVALGGTSVIIVVGVALETVKSLENQMLMRHYKGFLDQ